MCTMSNRETRWALPTYNPRQTSERVLHPIWHLARSVSTCGGCRDSPNVELFCHYNLQWSHRTAKTNTTLYLLCAAELMGKWKMKNQQNRSLSSMRPSENNILCVLDVRSLCLRVLWTMRFLASRVPRFARGEYMCIYGHGFAVLRFVFASTRDSSCCFLL